ncbi:MAG TPA: translation initiation factor IF-2 [Candidatus Babeliaceae bacterium]|nr:translation initiation factor IF-2 [Candidatus Babeliaceae bacterium]
MATRVYEFSKKHGIANKELISLLHENGFSVANHMAVLSPEALAFLERKFKGEVTSKTPTSIKPRDAAQSSNSSGSRAQREASAIVQPKEAAIPLAPMSVADIAFKVGKPVSEVILWLLKEGIVATKNQVVSEKVVSQIARTYNIKIEEGPKQEKLGSVVIPSVEGRGHARAPVVVVIGHVDHGKTTLLDFIRNTRVAAKEKGGITQHLGAYEANTPQGSIVFLDTPGHEAFSMMRERGTRIADIAILVVAADDGVMPQTIEAIKHAQSIGLPVVVALNKIDKVSPQQIEAVKQSLSGYGLLPEEWGGQAIFVPISAKVGTGISELLDIIILQAQIMELGAERDVPARGYILESRIQKGRGPVATVICQQGTLRVGDFFRYGNLYGKVTSLTDYKGKALQQALPSQPVQVAGFPDLPQAGEQFAVVDQSEARKSRPVAEQRQSQGRGLWSENMLNVIFKVDSASSKEALVHAVSKISDKFFRPLNILSAAVGPCTENDVLLASDAKAIIYTFHSRVEPSALAASHRVGVVVRSFDIIYRLLEDLEEVAEQGRPIKMVTKKIGEAVVLKVFDIKHLGVIAGAQVKAGRFVRDGRVVIWRGKHKVGEGPIQSLQREKRPAKEVHAGFECGFMVEGFSDWRPDDRVECYLEVPEST